MVQHLNFITRQRQRNRDRRATSLSEHPLGDRTQEHSSQAGSTPRAYHDEIRPESCCLIEDASNRRAEDRTYVNRAVRVLRSGDKCPKLILATSQNISL